MRAPLFWQDHSLPARWLQPLASLYGLASQAGARFSQPAKAAVPVICVGNLVAGGAGKTPVALAITAFFQQRGKNVFLLTRGHGGSLKGPLRVDALHYRADEVGDETLLLAERAPTVMAKHRARGAEAATDAGAQLIIMDDGFQNRTLHKDLSLLVVDGWYGFGNGKLLPAGPLREPIEEGIARAHAFVLVGEDRHNLAPMLASHHPVLRARMELSADVAHLRGQRVVAFAGIGRPEKFFQSLRDFGCEVKNATGFPDHHRFRESDMRTLRQQAEARQAQLVTTQKDYVRLPEAWRDQVIPVPARLVFDDEAALLSLLSAYC